MKAESRTPLFRRRGWALAGLFLPLVALTAWLLRVWLAPPAPDERLAIPIVVQGDACSITVEQFRPAGSGPWPAIVLLHGVEGARRYRWDRHRTADRLRDQGYAVFVVHYFDAMPYDDLWLLTMDGALDVEAVNQRVLADARRWIETAAAVVDALARRPEVDPQRIALDGYSLGGYISLATAQRLADQAELADVQGVVVHWASCFQDTPFSAGFPDALFIHGEQDPIVPLKDARSAAALVAATGAEADFYVVPGAGHVAGDAESIARSDRFFARRLRDAR